MIAATKNSADALPKHRPRTLAEAARRGRAFGDIDAHFREFLDEFYRETNADKRAAMVLDEPPLVESDRENAYLAAIAEHLAFRYHLPVPPWVNGEARFLKRAFFPSGLESLKASLLVESPTAFRRRLIFVGADPLYRPRRDVPNLMDVDVDARQERH